MTPTTRRRFLIDLAFAGGALALIAGLAYTGKGKSSTAASPTATPNVASTSPPPPVPGNMVQPPPVKLGGKPANPLQIPRTRSRDADGEAPMR